MGLDPCNCRSKKEAHVMIIYTGGTIGMKRNAEGVLAPVKNMMAQNLRQYPGCHDDKYQGTPRGSSTLVLPFVEGAPYRIVYDIVEYDPLLDSSCMSYDEWRRIAKDIGRSYADYDGFVVLHGTDTLAYTASALSFMLQDLAKPVVVTGAQISIFETRSDGRNNFLSSVLLAGNYNIPEVIVFFGSKVLRGCRTTKISSEALIAFDSPNEVPLGHAGVTIDINGRQIFRSCTSEKFSVYDQLEPNIGLLRFYPGISGAVIRSFLKEPLLGAVIQSFGSGNIPSNRQDILNELQEAVDRGVIIVNITQCLNGMVVPIYETGNILKDIGVLPGYDMTQEAALTKLAYVLGKSEWDLHNKKKIMLLNIRGEMTTNKVAKTNDIDLIEGVARTLHLTTSKEREQMCGTFFPALVIAAVLEGDDHKLSVLKQYGANLCDTNCDGRTALHFACFSGNLNVCCYLLQEGCSPNVRDRFNRTALHEAVDTDNQDIIELLRQNGATLNDAKDVQAGVLRSLSERGAIKRLESFRLAGADLTIADRTGRTSLHYACQLGNPRTVEYLLQFYSNRYIKDELNMTPMDYAKASNKVDIIALLRSSQNTNAKNICQFAIPK